MCVYINKVIDELSSLKKILTSTFKSNEDKIDIGKIDDEISDKVLEEEERKRVRDIVIIQKFIKSGQEIYENLNFSVISGSYVQNEKFEDKISECETLINDIRTLIPEGETISDIIDTFFCRFIIDSLKLYHSCVHTLQIRISQPGKFFLLSDFENDARKENKISTHLDELKPYHDLFHYNILLTFIDKTLSLRPHILRELLDILHQLKSHRLKNEIYCKILIDKCTLLIFKFKLKYDNEELFQSLLISHDFTDEEFDPNKLQTTYLTDFQNIIVHRDDHSFLKEHFKKHKKDEILNFTDFYLLIRYYSIVESSYKDINKLINKFKDQFESLESVFDIHSYNISLNYLFNNKISFFYSHKLYSTPQEIDALYEELIRLQTRTDVKNYFPFYKIALCYSDIIEDKIVKNEDFKKEDLILIKPVIKKFQDSISLMEKYLKWADRTDFLPYQPPYTDCCVKIRDERYEANIFLVSAYVVPVDFTGSWKKLKDLQAKAQLYTSVIQMKDFLLREHDFVQEAHNVAKEGQKNNIQILSVFAALVIFAVGNMQIFKTVETLKDAIIFMLTLAYSLCLFSLVIWFIVSYKKSELTKAHKTLIGCLILGFIFSIYVIFTDLGSKNIAYSKELPQNEILNNSEQNPLTDSLEFKDTKVNSIK